MDVFFSDFDSYSDSGSSEDQEHNELMYGGQASCILSNLEETIGKIDDFLLFERGFVHGDIVCSTEDPSGQMGRVIGVDMVVDLENVYGGKLKDINSKNLQRIRSISTGDYVVVGPWVGKADKIVDCVTVLFDDGTKCNFTGMGEEKLIPLSPDLVDDAQIPYYPGQRVKVELSAMSKSARWFCGAQKNKTDEGTVCAVDAGFVYINWLGCAAYESEKIPAPPSLQCSKDLTSLSLFSHSNWQLGDWCMLLDTNSAGAMGSMGRDFYVQSRKLRKRGSLVPSSQEIYVIAKTKTKVDVLWQDGSQSWGLDSNSLLPVNTVDAHDFWPHQFVLEKGTSDDEQIKKWGVVKTVDAQEKIVRVQWERKEEKSLEETVSAYELIEHPDYSHSLGDVVFRLQKGETVKGNDGCHNNMYLSHIGIVIGFEDGIVEVKWAAGFTSKISPAEIFRLDKSEGMVATPLLHDENAEQNQEKSEHDNQAPSPNQKDMLDVDGDDKDCLHTLHGSTSFSVPRAAIEFISSVAARLFGYPAYTSLESASENEPKSGIDDKEDHQVPVEIFIEKKIEEEIQECKDDSFSSADQNINEVRQFDMVNDCSDHHFVDGAGKGLASNQVKRGWLKKVQQEWKILQKDLPETIYVRVFEERMDLLHAAIVGAPGTPYHDGLFFFDIFLPPEYPHEPPMVHYKSGGLRVNPNLYESGKVCLSLLNTWSGTGTETWNPEGSTILQVLLSLQALVLNKKPYFNEAGYDRQIGSAEGEKNSCSYNENAFLVSCKTMLYTLRKPPKHFEALVEEHFKQRGKYILMACKTYMEGVPIGCALETENVDQEDQKGTSTGFKIMLAKLFPKLVEAFTKKGIDCSEYIEIVK